MKHMKQLKVQSAPTPRVSMAQVSSASQILRFLRAHGQNLLPSRHLAVIGGGVMLRDVYGIPELYRSLLSATMASPRLIQNVEHVDVARVLSSVEWHLPMILSGERRHEFSGKACHLYFSWANLAGFISASLSICNLGPSRTSMAEWIATHVLSFGTRLQPGQTLSEDADEHFSRYENAS